MTNIMPIEENEMSQPIKMDVLKNGEGDRHNQEQKQKIKDEIIGDNHNKNKEVNLTR